MDIMTRVFEIRMEIEEAESEEELMPI